jgi:hypothetical protein
MEIQQISSSPIFKLHKAYDSVMGEVLHNSVIECVINMKLAIITKM